MTMDAERKFIFICGSHCSGKTTVIGRLLREGIIQLSGDEIGKRLFYERRLNTGLQTGDFEVEVTDLELARDRDIAAADGVSCVETWHPGNLAYAAVRNPCSVAGLAAKMRGSCLMDRAIGIWLRVPPGRIRQRTRTFADQPDWAEDFYRKIDDQLGRCLDLLGLAGRTMEITSNDGLDNVYHVVAKFIRNDFVAQSRVMAESPQGNGDQVTLRNKVGLRRLQTPMA